MKLRPLATPSNTGRRPTTAAPTTTLLSRNIDDLRCLGWNSEEEGNGDGATESEATTESGGSREKTSEQQP
ncbi:hypothetical protein BDA96_05G026900 [Sorghum bicolor]|uniref:Uncharacterized protein n=2 Tax=Sorghum bicolor TaxID=4558 RepID=A0A1B6PPU3_SORBI|nr:hypothetical protein BDA96_05G026900 [Sorghum bicolor]KXG27685.1 hypothetical protein SORBI_3005G026700 [Sorghum bicolor]OQU82825.1 hypothetical protein SORBI_3005G026700 [Sorghum bicolor]